MTIAESSAVDALSKRVVAMLNTASGGWNIHADARMKEIFEAAGLPHAEVVSVPPSEIEAALDHAVAGADVLVVLGGDGTIRSAAAKCAGFPGFLVPLPGGTMNMLPHALYGTRAWPQALADTLANPEIHHVSGGQAGGHAFFVAALLGAPTLWADARESLRAGRLAEAVGRSLSALRRGYAEPLEYVFGDTLRGGAEAVAVVCPLISKVMNEDEPMLEAAAIDPETAGATLRLGLHALFDDWRADPTVTLAKVRSLSVTGHGRVPVILDGERIRMGRRVNISFTPLAFRTLVPAHAEAPPASP
jgi:diacylglycerol kinase family enzyme